MSHHFSLRLAPSLIVRASLWLQPQIRPYIGRHKYLPVTTSQVRLWSGTRPFRCPEWRKQLRVGYEANINRQHKLEADFPCQGNGNCWLDLNEKPPSAFSFRWLAQRKSSPFIVTCHHSPNPLPSVINITSATGSDRKSNPVKAIF